jgi:hypothetical protein
MGFLVQCSQCGTLFAKGLCPKCGHVEDPDIVEKQRWIYEQYAQRKARYETHRAIWLGLFTSVLVTSVSVVALIWKARDWEWRRLTYDPHAHDIAAIFGGVVLLIVWGVLTFLWIKSRTWWPVELACPGCEAPLDHLRDGLFCPQCFVPLETSQPLPARKYPARPPRTQKYDPAKTPRPVGKRGSRPNATQTPTPPAPSTSSSETVNDDGVLALALTLKDHVDSLPEQQREMLQLRAEGYEPREIAAKTERSTRTVEWCLEEVRKRLKDMLKTE